MATIVTRSGKGSPLTNTEVDSNFTNLNTDKIEDAPSDGSNYARQSGAWVAVNDSAVIVTSSTAPSSPSDGDVWYSESNGVTYVYYDDGTSSQWVATGAPTASLGGVASLEELSDVNINSPAINHILEYNSSTSKWVNQPQLCARWESTGQGFSSSSSYVITGTWSLDKQIIAGSGVNAVSESSGVFTFYQTGIWEIIIQGRIYISSSGTATSELQLETTTDGGTNWSAVGNSLQATSITSTYTATEFFEVTSTSNCKVRFKTSSSSTNSTNTVYAYPIFRRLGAT